MAFTAVRSLSALDKLKTIVKDYHREKYAV